MNWLFRTDVGDGVGLGHFVRDLALADAAADQGITPYFVLSGEHGAAREFLERRSIEFCIQTGSPGSQTDRKFTIERASAIDAAVVIVDGYRFDLNFFLLERPVVAIDERPISPDVTLLVDIDPGAAEKPRILDGVRLLAGPKYALLRREFRASKYPRNFGATIARVLVMLGGEDVRKQTDVVLEGLARAGFGGTAVVVAREEPSPDFPYSIEHHELIENMAEVMFSCDLAVTAAGGTVWELCATGTPSVVVVSADNQRSIGDWIPKSGVAHSVGWWEDVDADDFARSISAMSPERRRELSRTAQLAVDGQGPDRVVEAILEEI